MTLLHRYYAALSCTPVKASTELGDATDLQPKDLVWIRFLHPALRLARVLCRNTKRSDPRSVP